MGILGTPEDEETFTNWLDYKWCNKCKKRIHLSNFKKDKNSIHYDDCKKHSNQTQPNGF